MKMSYSEIINWLNRFPTFKQQVTVLTSVIGDGVENGCLSRVDDYNGVQYSYIVFNDSHLLKFEIRASDRDLTDLATEIEVYSLKSLVNKKLIFKNPSKNQFTGNMTFQALECTLEFSNGDKLTISSTEYDETLDEFIEVISLLLTK
jgi:hypothetical protein